MDYPIEVCIGDSSRILFEGIVEMGGYHVWVKHGFQRSIPGTAECVSISLDEACKWVFASASAQLLANWRLASQPESQRRSMVWLIRPANSAFET